MNYRESNNPLLYWYYLMRKYISCIIIYQIHAGMIIHEVWQHDDTGIQVPGLLSGYSLLYGLLCIISLYSTIVITSKRYRRTWW